MIISKGAHCKPHQICPVADSMTHRPCCQVDIPKLFNPVTNLLAPQRQLPRLPKPGKQQLLSNEEANGDTASLPPANGAHAAEEGGGVNGAGSAPPSGKLYVASAKFSGRRPGYVFKLGSQGLGYYWDTAVAPAPMQQQQQQEADLDTDAVAAPTADGDEGEEAGWRSMKTVAQLRRAAGVGAPRLSDSLYRPVERAPRKFNPLKVRNMLLCTRCVTSPLAVPES